MGAKSQRKGREGELEICRILNTYGIPAEPGVPASYGSTPDIMGVPGIHPEIKRCQQLRIPDWMKQAAEDAEKFGDGAPTIFFQRNREPWAVIMRLEDWITLYTRQKSPKSAEEGGTIQNMTPRKEKALQALLVSRTRAEAAKAAGIGKSTLRTYLQDPEFSAAYKHAAAGIMDGATRQLQQNLTAAVDRLGKIVADDDENSMAQISAAKTLLEYGLKFTEFNDVLKELEKADVL